MCKCNFTLDLAFCAFLHISKTARQESETKGAHHIHSLRSSCFINSIQRRLLRSWNSRSKAYLVTLAKVQDTPARDVARSHSSCTLSFDLIGQGRNKSFHVADIVLPLGFADVIFRRERRDDRNCVCCSQARLRQTGTILSAFLEQAFMSQSN